MRVRIVVDGVDRQVEAGLPLASALLAEGLRRLRVSPRLGAPRGAFCFMGVCQECLVTVDERLSRACQTPVREGMRVDLGRRGEV